MPRKRILPTLINYDIAVLIFIILRRYYSNHTFSVAGFLKLLTGWNSAGNSNWYIFCILIMYVLAWLGLLLYGTDNRAVIFVMLNTIVYIMVMRTLKEEWWYNTALCFSVGMLYSCNKEKFEKWISKAGILWLEGFSVSFLILYSVRSIWYSNLIRMVVFAVIVLLVSRYVHIDSPILKWAGKNLFPLYIYQRLPMILLQDSLGDNGRLYFIVCFAITICIAFIYQWIYKGVKGALKKLPEFT